MADKMPVFRYPGNVVGLEFNQGTDSWTRIDIAGRPISAPDFDTLAPWKDIVRVNLAADGTVNAVKGDAGFALDGSNGEVMVRVPKFYALSTNPKTGLYRWWVADSAVADFEVYPAFFQGGGTEQDYIYGSAYECCLKDDAGTLKLHSKTGEQPWTGGEIDSLAFNSGSTVFTTGETLTGATSGATGQVVDWHLDSGSWAGGNAAGTVYLKQVSGTYQAENLNGSTGGSNMAGATGANSALSLAIGDARTYGGNIGTGWGQMDIWMQGALTLLAGIEWGNLDSQSEVGRGIVDKAGGTGFAGEETGAYSIDDNLQDNGTIKSTYGGAAGDPTNDGKYPIAWRGFENLWGNTWHFVDGYNAKDAEYRIVNSDGTGSLADTLTAGNYEASTATPITSDGYIDDVEWESLLKYLFIASSTSGGSSTHLPDYFWAHDSGETNILLAGADWKHGARAGVACRNSRNVASVSLRGIGARSRYIS